MPVGADDGKLILPRALPSAAVWGLVVFTVLGGFYTGSTLTSIQNAIEKVDQKLESAKERTVENKDAIRSLQQQIDELQRFLRRVNGSNGIPFDPAMERATAPGPAVRAP